MCPDEERPAENTDVLSRGLTRYGRISAPSKPCLPLSTDGMVYINDKPLLTVCDNTVFVKKLPELAALMAGAAVGCPYDGAKEHYILDIDDTALTAQVIAILEPITPVPRKRKKA